jgi:hypothetical protein
MVDKLVSVDTLTAVSEFVIKKDNIFCQDGYFQEVGMIENVAQTTAAKLGYMFVQTKQYEQANVVPVGYIGGITDLKIFSYPEINDTLVTEISIIKEVFNINLISATVKVNDLVIMTCEMKLFIEKNVSSPHAKEK